MISAVRSVDLLLLMIDAQNIHQIDLIERELHAAGLRLNQRKPDVVISKKGHGGITVNTTVPLTHLNERHIKSIASEFVINADITLRDDLTEDQLIDSFAQNRVYVPALVIINKTDLASPELLRNTIKRLHEKKWVVCAISAKVGEHLEELRNQIFLQLRLIRVYLKPVERKLITSNR